MLTTFKALACLALTLTFCASTAVAHDPFDPTDVVRADDAHRPLMYVVPRDDQISTLYHDGSQIVVHIQERWRPMCHSSECGGTLDDLIAAAEKHYAAFADGPAVVVDNNARGAGLDIVYNCDSSVPSEALASFAMAEAYLESLFSNDVTVTINVSFDSLGGGTLGFCQSSTVSGVNYRNSRLSLQLGMDSDDVIQDWLPGGNACPVRYDGSSATVSNENMVVWNKSPYKATVGTVTGVDAGMVFDTGTNWDYDPSNGINWNRISLVDTICHETGHCFGFTSATDNGSYMEVLDLFRFCRDDGAYDYNPDTYQEFQTCPRLVDFNNPNDTHITDGIDFSHRMEDGDPYQASHLRQANDAGCMCPTIGSWDTRYPDFYTIVDIHCFDLIGWNYPACSSAQFTVQPEASQMLCEGETAVLSVAVDNPAVTYQWRRGPVLLTDDGVHVFGAATDTLTLVGLTEDDTSNDYNCFVHTTSDHCPAISDWAEIIVDTDTPVFTSQPEDVTCDAGWFAQFEVEVEEAFWMEFQWRKNGVPIENSDRINGAATDTLSIFYIEAGDAGQYDCFVTRLSGSMCTNVSDAATLTVNGGVQDCPNPGASGNYCHADIDGSEDCIVGLGDLAQLLANYGMTAGAERLDGDIEPTEGDGDVDLGDLAALLAQYGDDCN